MKSGLEFDPSSARAKSDAKVEEFWTGLNLRPGRNPENNAVGRNSVTENARSGAKEFVTGM